MSDTLYATSEWVVRVLLIDGWHDVAEDTFVVGKYGYADPPEVLGADGRVSFEGGVGFSFLDDASDDWIYGPLASLIAVSERPRRI